MKSYIVFFIFSFFYFCTLIGVPAGYASENADNYIKMLNSDNIVQRTTAAKKITGSGLTEPELFNLIKEKLLNNYQSNPENPDHIDEMAWLCKALASSGNMEYQSTLQSVAENTTSLKLQRYALQSIDHIEDYARRNKIMASETEETKGLPSEIKKYINMLRADGIKLKTTAAKSIYRGGFSEVRLFDVVEEELIKGGESYYQAMRLYDDSEDDESESYSPDSNFIDMMAWFCKALGASGMEKYKATLREIIKNSNDPKLSKYARQGLAML